MLFDKEYEFLYGDTFDGNLALDKEQMLYLTIAGNKFKYLIDTLKLIKTTSSDKLIIRVIDNTLENIKLEYDILEESIK